MPISLRPFHTLEKAIMTDINQYIQKEDICSLLQKLIRSQSLNPPGDVRECAHLVADELKRRGLPAEILEEKPLSQPTAEAIISRLEEEGVLTRREAALMRAVLDREVLNPALAAPDYFRSRLLRVMLFTLLREDF